MTVVMHATLFDMSLTPMFDLVISKNGSTTNTADWIHQS